MNDPQPEGHMASYIGRRELLAALGGAAAVRPLAARAQQPAPAAHRPDSAPYDARDLRLPRIPRRRGVDELRGEQCRCRTLEEAANIDATQANCAKAGSLLNFNHGELRIG